jgi:hypothetical protein
MSSSNVVLSVSEGSYTKILHCVQNDIIKYFFIVYVPQQRMDVRLLFLPWAAGSRYNAIITYDFIAGVK